MKVIQNNILYLDGITAGDKAIYDAFSLGFSDYQISFDMPFDSFIDRFFGIEGNDRALSYVAYDGENPIAVLLGGIDTYDQLPTLRCGALSVAPNYRGEGVSEMLMQLHEQDGIKSPVRQLMLEVLGDNHRAIRFYEKNNYLKTTLLYYYSLTKEGFRKRNERSITEKSGCVIIEASLEALKISHTHTNWQNDLNYIAKDPLSKIYAIVKGDEVYSFIAFNTKGKIYRIYTSPEYRSKGYASALLAHTLDSHAFDKVVFSCPATSQTMHFLKQRGFQKDALFQYEMIKPL